MSVENESSQQAGAGEPSSSYRNYRQTSNAIPSFQLRKREEYSSWKFKMRNYLMHEELWETIDGYLQGDPTPVDIRNRNDKRALAKICLTLDGSAITHVRCVHTALEAWTNLQKAYEDKSMGRKLALERKLYRLNLQDYENMETYIDAVISTAQDLADIGKVIEDASVAAILLGGLTSKYEPLIMALENSNIAVSTEIVKGKLLNQMAKEEIIDGALRTKYMGRYDKPRCYDCGVIGHKRPDCPLRRNKTKQDNKEKDSSSFKALGITDNLKKEDLWYVDSGATKHMTSRKEWFQILRSLTGKVTVADGNKINCGGIGDILINTSTNIDTISDVVYVPNLNTNLLSVKQAVDKGLVVLFDKNNCTFYKSDTFSFTGDPVMRGSSCGGLYALDCTVALPDLAYDVHSDLSGTSSRYMLWHRRLGHLCRIGMNRMKKSHAGIDFTEIDKTKCIACVKGKQSRKPFKNHADTRATSVLELVHSDLCGPMSETSFQGNRYALIFVDDFSRMISVYFISSKSEVKETFCTFQALVERQTNAKIKSIRTDNGSEFVNRELELHLSSVGIEHQTTVPYSPQQNGVAERTNRSIVEKARSMLSGCSLPKGYWEDAFKTSVYLKNRSPHRALDHQTPFEKWHGYKSDLSHLRIFGCRALIHIPSCHRKKLDVKAEEAIFVGYTEDPNGYYFRDARYPRRIIKSRDVTFFEDNFSSLKINDCIECVAPNCEPNAEVLLSGSVNRETTLEPIFSGNQPEEFDDKHVPERTCKETVRTENEVEDDYQSAQEEEEEGDGHEVRQNITEPVPIDDHLESNSNGSEDMRRYPSRIRKPPNFFGYRTCNEELVEPKTYLEAVNAQDADKWRSAMEAEYNSLVKQKTWKLVDKPQKRVIPCKWVYKLKTDAHGNIIKYKARLVAKGFNQVEGIDYTETFAPVVRQSSLRTLFALTAEMNLKMKHLDVDTAFLYGELDEEVYLEQPQGFRDKDQKEKVCLLQKSLYGLKQAPRAWNKKLDETLSKLGFNKTPSEPCVYTKLFGEEKVIIAVYVDDIIVFYKNDTSFELVKQDLQTYFSLKDLGELKYYLGLNVTRSDKKVIINQKTYILEVLKRFGMSDCKSVDTPLSGKTLTYGDSKGSEGEGQMPYFPYQNLLGCLMFLVVNTRPDIAFATSYLSQFNTRYDKSHWLEAKRVLQYLKGTIDYSLTYTNLEENLKGYTDSDWANCPHDRRSYTGYHFNLAGAPVAWESKKQSTVALSSTEAEYMALAAATKEACYLRRFIFEIRGKLDRVIICNDSQSAQNLVNNPVHHSRTKHIDTKFHFTRDKVAENIIELKYIQSSEMSADVLTKPLGRLAHQKCITKMGVMK